MLTCICCCCSLSDVRTSADLSRITTHAARYGTSHNKNTPPPPGHSNKKNAHRQPHETFSVPPFFLKPRQQRTTLQHGQNASQHLAPTWYRSPLQLHTPTTRTTLLGITAAVWDALFASCCECTPFFLFCSSRSTSGRSSYLAALTRKPQQYYCLIFISPRVINPSSSIQLVEFS